MDAHSGKLLRSARDLVARGWVQGADARSTDGAAVQPWAADAVGWSLLGAIVAALEAESAAGKDLPLEQLAAAMHALAEFVTDDSLAGWNDDPSRTQQQVMDTLLQAAGRDLRVVE